MSERIPPFSIFPDSYRFMVMERLGQDLQRIFEDCGSKFKKEIVLQLGARMVCTEREEIAVSQIC